MLRRAQRQQPQQAIEFDPYWVARGLVYAFIGNRRFVTRNGLRPVGAIVGSPKNLTVPGGFAQGFGSTSGGGSTDSLTGPPLALSEGIRSIVTRYFANSTGGGGFGRVMQSSVGTGLDAAEAIYPGSATRLTYVRYSTGGAGQWGLAGGTLITGSWQTFGITHDQRGVGTNPIFYENGYQGTVTVLASPSGAYTTGLYNPMFGNRAAADRGMDGAIGDTLIFDHPFLGLTDAEHLALSLNPYQVFKGGKRAFLVAVQGGSGISGTIAATNTGDTAAAAGTPVLVGAIAKTNGNDTASAVGSPVNVGTIAKTNGSDTAAASGSPVNVGTVTATNGNDSAALTGSVGSNISGTIAATNAGDTAAASGTPVSVGAISATNGNDSATLVGKLVNVAVIAATNGNDTAALSGVAGAVSGAISATERGDTAALSGISGNEIPRNAGFEMNSSSGRRVHTVHRKPLLRKIMDERAEAVAVTLANKEKRRRAKLRENMAAKVVLEESPDAEKRLESLVQQWKDLGPVADGEPLKAAEAYRVFMAHVAQQLQRLQDDDDEEAIALLLL